MPSSANIHRAMRRAAVLPVAVALVAANCGLAATNPSGSEAALLAAADTPLIKNTGKSKPSASEIEPAATEPSAAGKSEEPLPTPTQTHSSKKPQPAQTETSSSNKAWIYGGLGVVAAGAVVAVVASGGGGGGGGDKPDTCNEPTPVNTKPRPPVVNNPNNTPVCADLSGQWSGTLKLADEAGVSLSATIAQNGDQIQVTTSSPKAYGKLFIGTVDPNCNFNLWDQTTGEQWTSNAGPGSANRIAIYDYVQTSCYGNTKYDSLILTR